MSGFRRQGFSVGANSSTHQSNRSSGMFHSTSGPIYSSPPPSRRTQSTPPTRPKPRPLSGPISQFSSNSQPKETRKSKRFSAVISPPPTRNGYRGTGVTLQIRTPNLFSKRETKQSNKFNQRENSRPSSRREINDFEEASRKKMTNEERIQKEKEKQQKREEERLRREAEKEKMQKEKELFQQEKKKVQEQKQKEKEEKQKEKEEKQKEKEERKKKEKEEKEVLKQQMKEAKEREKQEKLLKKENEKLQKKIEQEKKKLNVDVPISSPSTCSCGSLITSDMLFCGDCGQPVAK